MINADRNYKRVYEKDFGKRCKRLLAYIYTVMACFLYSGLFAWSDGIALNGARRVVVVNILMTHDTDTLYSLGCTSHK